jgi:hypothetical protein
MLFGDCLFEQVYWIRVNEQTNQSQVDLQDPYHSEPRLREIPLTVWNLPRIPLLALIRLYQKTISPGLPPSCIFYPSCSHYGYQVIYKYGAIKGTAMTVWRLLRCNPFNRGGYDPVP